MARLSRHPSIGVALSRLQEGLTVTRMPLTSDQCAAIIDELELRDAARASAELLAAERLSNMMDERQRANAAERVTSDLRGCLRRWLEYTGLRHRAFEPDLDPDDSEYETGRDLVRVTDRLLDP